MIDLLRAQLGISGIASLATDVTIRAESSILELAETADGVAILLPFARSQIQVAVRTSDRSQLPAASCTASRARDRSMVPGSYGL